MNNLNVNPTAANGTHHTSKPHKIPHFAALPNETISFLTPYSGLLMTLWMVILFAAKNWLLENFVFPRYYKNVLSRLNDGDKRGFLVHHISAGVKIVLLVVGAKPFCDVVFGNSALHDPFSRAHHRPTMGDILLVLTQLFVALYVFELFTRKRVSLITSFHHVGAIVIAQSAVVFSLDLDHQTNATMEFVLCLVWAAFDVLSELWLNLAFVLYRIYPNRHGLLAYVFGSTMLLNVCGTFAETVMIMTLFGQSWSRWELPFKIITPILHVLFTVAQLHCARVLFALWVKEKKRLYEEERRIMDPEANKEDDPKNSNAVKVSSNPSDESSNQRADSVSNSDTNTEDKKTKKSWIIVCINKFFTGRK
jgi:hypothetical protein